MNHIPALTATYPCAAKRHSVKELAFERAKDAAEAGFLPHFSVKAASVARLAWVKSGS
jgi:hypothetical protein